MQRTDGEIVLVDARLLLPFRFSRTVLFIRKSIFDAKYFTMAKAPSPKKSTKKAFQPDYAELKKASLALRAIDHKIRLKILEFLNEKGESPVTPIYNKLRLEQSLASMYLGLLRRAGLVKTRREGQKIYYSVNYEKIETLKTASKIIIG